MDMSDSNSNSQLSDSFDEEDEASDNALTASSSTDSSSDDDDMQEEEDSQLDALELAKICKEQLQLPRGLCENSAIFQEFFSMSTWQLLSENFRTYLKNKHLPQFPADHNGGLDEQEKCVEMLFTNKLQRFGQTPLRTLQRNLEEGNYRPDVLKLQQSILKSRKREVRFQACERVSQMAKQMFISRERLLRATYNCGPDIVPKPQYLRQTPKSVMHFDASVSALRARKRFGTEIKQIALRCGIDELTDDEEEINSTNFEMLNMSEQKEVRVKVGSEENQTCKPNSTTEKCIFGTQFKRKHALADEDAARAQYEAKLAKLSHRNFKQYLQEHKRRKTIEQHQAEYETIDIRLRDVYARAQVGGNFKRVFASGKTPGRKPKSKIDEIKAATNGHTVNEEYGEENAKDLTSALVESPHKTAAVLVETPFEGEMQNTKQYSPLKPIESEPQQLVAHGNVAPCVESLTPFAQTNDVTSVATVDATLHKDVLGEQLLNAHELNGKTVATLQMNDTFLDTNTSQIAPHNIELLTSTTTTPVTTITNNIFPEEDEEYEEEDEVEHNVFPFETATSETTTAASLKTHLQTAASPELIQETHSCYFSLVRDFFCATPNHRMRFDDLKAKVNVWLCNPITALNDWYALADSWSALLSSAINFLAGDFPAQPAEYVPYIEYKAQQNIYQWIGAGRDSDARLLELSNYWLTFRNKNEVGQEQKLEHAHIRRRSTEMDVDEAAATAAAAYDRGSSPPPLPRCPTVWTVTAASANEVAEFQRQERERFEQPHRAFTYKMHGYESVVGPVKGIYTQILALTKARGHSMMIGDRPNFVTILTLVRDATARLPNGEGTRADISELLKCSQYINRDAAENVLQTIVSGALDRMHTEHDPCVRYDPKRKIWIYLHRNRTEDEFERMHQQYQGLGKHKKPTNRKPKTKCSKDGSDIESNIVLVSSNAFNSTSNNCIVSSTITASSATTASNSSSNNIVHALPALVPSNPIIVNASSFQQIPALKAPLPKCPPVPPLKYNIQPLMQQQKSLLKPALQPPRQSIEAKSELTATIQTNDFSNHLNSFSTAGANTTTSSVSGGLLHFPSKSLSFVSGSQPGVKGNSGTSNSNTTPIVVATPTGFKTVHVSNATSVTPSNAGAAAAVGLHRTDVRSTTHTPTLSATVGGKKVALNKPIIINHITQQTPLKTKATQLPQKQPQQQHLQQQQPSLVMPMMTKVSETASPKQTQLQPPLYMEHSSKLATTTQTAAQLQQQQQQQLPPQAAKNIIRLLPSSVAGVGASKSLITLPVQSAKTPVQIIGQRVLTSANALRPQMLQKPLGGGISLITSNAHNPTAAATTANTMQQPGAIVRMSSQAFATLQQQQQKQQQNVVIKSQQQQQRIIVGKPVGNMSNVVNKNIIVQQLPGAQMAAPKTNQQQAQQQQQVSIQNTQPAVISFAPQAASNTKTIQTINANSLTPQQQKLLLQNLKQQSVQFKTLQVMPGNAQQQQPMRLHGTQTLKIAGNTAQPLLKTVAPQQKTLIVSQQQQNATTIDHQTTGQIITLEGLIAKQQNKTVRVAPQLVQSKAPHSGANIIQLTTNSLPQQDATVTAAPHYAVVSQARNLISVGSTPQQVVSAQSALTPTAISVASSKYSGVTKFLTTGAKIVASSGHVVQPHIVNTSIFGKTNVVSASGGNLTTTAGFRVISTGAAGNFNIANIHGKQVILASKPGALNATGSLQKLQNSGIILGGQSAKLQTNSNVKLLNKSGAATTSQANNNFQTVIMGNQILRLDQLQSSVKQLQTNRITVASTAPTHPLTTVANTNTGTIVVNSNESMFHPQQPQQSTDNMPKTLILGSTGQTIRLQAQQPAAQTQQSAMRNVVVSNAQKKPPTSRVVLAVQGGGQIFLSPNYQGGSLNLKSLQNVKVVSMAPTQSVATLADSNQQQLPTKTTTSSNYTQQSMLRTNSGLSEES